MTEAERQRARSDAAHKVRYNSEASKKLREDINYAEKSRRVGGHLAYAKKSEHIRSHFEVGTPTEALIKKLSAEEKLVHREGEYYYEGRPLIFEDRPINGGVYVVPGKEAIVVDFAKDLSLAKLYIEARNAISIRGEVQREYVLDIVKEVVRRRMPHVHNAEREVERFLEREGIREGKKVQLGLFLASHVGTDRHYALAVAALIERFKQEGFLRGKVSVDSSYPEFLKEQHVWARYTNSIGNVYIFDKGEFGFYAGRLDRRKGSMGYARPEDE